ncbi:MAG: hypothetical protein HKO65_00230, partial [Gemmatimonadetes bacterium]|nr:hypothetical protein [Gemmatimonadota bacterium]
MLFNSLAFAVFLPLAFTGYWLLRHRLQAQNAFVLVASYVFYGWWDWRFLILIAFSSLLDFAVGLGLGRAERQSIRRLLLATSLTANLGLLGFFKYSNFFLESFAELLTGLGFRVFPGTLEIILPVGISFFGRRRIVAETVKRGVRLVLVSTPTEVRYRDAIPEPVSRRFHELWDELLETPGVSGIDLADLALSSNNYLDFDHVS